jgi:hypothetical protein
MIQKVFYGKKSTCSEIFPRKCSTLVFMQGSGLYDKAAVSDWSEFAGKLHPLLSLPDNKLSRSAAVEKQNIFDKLIEKTDVFYLMC